MPNMACHIRVVVIAYAIIIKIGFVPILIEFFVFVAILRLRKEPLDAEAEKIIEANTSATNLVMHKDSVWNQQWESFKNSRMGERK